MKENANRNTRPGISITLLNKLQNTEYVDNDVDVDDVDDDEEGAAAYFFLVRDSDGHTNCELQECRGQAFGMGFSWATDFQVHCTRS